MLVAKEAMWLHLPLTELVLLQSNQQHALIKVSERNTSVRQIHQSLGILREEGSESGSNVGDGKSVDAGEIVILLKGDNQGLIAFVHNPVFHFRTKQIDIQHHYILDKVAAKKIQLSYIPTHEMIADGLTKALTHVKFHRFIEQMNIQWSRAHRKHRHNWQSNYKPLLSRNSHTLSHKTHRLDPTNCTQVNSFKNANKIDLN